jgi:hypothetical protein
MMTERNICDGKENMRDGKDILVYEKVRKCALKVL